MALEWLEAELGGRQSDCVPGWRSRQAHVVAVDLDLGCWQLFLVADLKVAAGLLCGGGSPMGRWRSTKQPLACVLQRIERKEREEGEKRDNCERWALRLGPLR